LQHHDKSLMPPDDPAIEIHLGVVHVRIDRLNQPLRWLMPLIATLTAIAAGARHITR